MRMQPVRQRPSEPLQPEHQCLRRIVALPGRNAAGVDGRWWSRSMLDGRSEVPVLRCRAAANQRWRKLNTRRPMMRTGRVHRPEQRFCRTISPAELLLSLLLLEAGAGANAAERASHLRQWPCERCLNASSSVKRTCESYSIRVCSNPTLSPSWRVQKKRHPQKRRPPAPKGRPWTSRACRRKSSRQRICLCLSRSMPRLRIF